MKKEAILFLMLSLTLIFSCFVLASNNVALSDQGNGVKEKATGNILLLGDLNVTIWDNATGGNQIYYEVFPNAIVNGSWNVMLGENSSNPLSLEYGKIYYKDYMIASEDADFTDINGNVVERMFFYAPLGDINSSDIAINSINETHIDNRSNLTIGSKITFLNGETIDNLLNSYLQITGNLIVGNNLSVSGGQIALDKTHNVITTLNPATNISIDFNQGATTAAVFSDDNSRSIQVFGNSIFTNITVSDKINFSLNNAMIDNFVKDWLRITGSLNITSQLALSQNGTIQMGAQNFSLIGKGVNMFWVGYNRRVGINTTTPRALLDVTGGDLYVEGNISSGNGILTLDGANGQLIFDSSKNLTFRSGPQKLFAFTTTGRLGVGTNRPRSVLHVMGDNVTIDGSAPGADLTIDMRGENTGYNINFDTDDGIVQHTPISINPRTGHLGIGTKAPDTNLTVSGAIRLIEQTSCPVTCGAAFKGAIYFNDTDTTFMGCNGTGWIRLDNIA